MSFVWGGGGGGGSGAVDSVAGKTGIVTLDHDDITDFDAILAAEAPVTTVAGKSGAVTLVNSDITDFDAGVAALVPVDTVAGRTGDVVITHTDLADFDTEVDARITAANLAAASHTHDGADIRPAVSTKTANYTIAAADEGDIILADSGSGAVQISTLTGLSTGYMVTILNIDNTNGVTIAAGASTTLTSPAGTTINASGSVTLINVGSNVFRAYGDLT